MLEYAGLRNQFIVFIQREKIVSASFAIKTYLRAIQFGHDTAEP